MEERPSGAAQSSEELDGSWSPKKSGRLLSPSSSRPRPEPFQIEGNSEAYFEVSRKFYRKRNCLGFWLDTDDIDDDGAHKVSGTFALFSVFILIFMGILTVKYLDAHLPEPLQIKDMKNHNNSFIEERARRDLHDLTSVGVRVSGSPVTDNITVSMFLSILDDIKSSIETANGLQLEFEIQRPTGSFYRDHTSCYSKIANVVAKLEPTNRSLATDDYILVNCHFDTKPGSPGATDNMISCASMLEVIRVLAAEQPTSLKNPIVFLFNGAEELGLQGAHGFVKGYEGPLGKPVSNQLGHRWAKNVRTFINLEGAGGGGREMLFQTGPGNSWTLEAYSKAALYPYGVVIAEEAFQIGLIPSDTDFRIFRDYSNLAGLDMAFSKNGWVYHTKWDRLSEIPPGSIQHMGANTLAIVKHFSSKVDFSEIKDSGGKMIYFDVLGLFMIYYPRWAGILIDCFIGFGTIALAIFTVRRKSENTRNLLMALLWLPLSAILSWAAGVGIAVLVALFFNVCGYYKPFYSYPTVAIVIFGIPAAISQIIVHSYAQNRSPVQAWISQKLALALVLVVLTFITRAVFIISINLLFSVISWHLLRFLCRGWPRGITLTYLITGEFIPFLMSFYLLTTLTDVFVPILGRSGSETNANIYLGVIVAAVLVILIWSGFSFVFVRYRRRILWLSFFAMFFVGNTLLVFGFIGKIPYQEKTPMRLNFVDVDRTWYNEDGVTVNKTEAGYWIWPYDSNTKDFLPILEKTVPELSSVETKKLNYENCENLYCAQPFTWPMEKSIKTTFWMPHKNSHLPESLKTNVTLSYNVTGSTDKTVDFELEGPTQISLILSPGPSYELVNWTLTNGPPSKDGTWKDRDYYFIYHGRGAEKQTIKFSIDLKLKGGSNVKTPLINVQYAGFYMYGDELMTDDFKDLVTRLPGWTYTMPWTSVVKMYKIDG